MNNVTVIGAGTIGTMESLSFGERFLSELMELFNSFKEETDASVIDFRVLSVPVEICNKHALCVQMSSSLKRPQKFSSRKRWLGCGLRRTDSFPSDTSQKETLVGAKRVYLTAPSRDGGISIKGLLIGGKRIQFNRIVSSDVCHSGECSSSSKYCYLNKEFQKNDTGTIPIVKRLQYKKRTMWAYWRQSIIMRKIFWKLLQALNAIGKVLYLKPKHKGGNILKTIFNQPNHVMIYS